MASRARLTPEQALAIKAKVDRIFASAIGTVATLVGIAAVWLAAWTAYKVLQVENRTPGVVLAGICLVIGAFFLLVGLRLMLNRPNRYGSILSPAGWRVLGSLFAIFCVGMLVFVLTAQPFSWESLPTVTLAIVAAAVFSYLCFRSAKRPHAGIER